MICFSRDCRAALDLLCLELTLGALCIFWNGSFLRLKKKKSDFLFEPFFCLFVCFVILRVDPDSPLHSDLQILKEKEGIEYILLNFSFKVRKL